MGKSSKNKSKKSSSKKQSAKHTAVTEEVVEIVEVVDVDSESESEETLQATDSQDVSVETNENQKSQLEQYQEMAQIMAEREVEILKLTKANVRDWKLLHRLNNRAIKESRKNRRSKNSSNRKQVKSGFNKPTAVPVGVASLFDIEEGTLLARTVVTKMIYQYIRDHNLQNPENKREIRPDSKIRKLFLLSKTDKLSFENFQTHMKKLYPPSQKDLAAKAAAEALANASA
jgi:chromatin remodeling complex protein RSC6